MAPTRSLHDMRISSSLPGGDYNYAVEIRTRFVFKSGKASKLPWIRTAQHCLLPILTPFVSIFYHIQVGSSFDDVSWIGHLLQTLLFLCPSRGCYNTHVSATVLKKFKLWICLYATLSGVQLKGYEKQ